MSHKTDTIVGAPKIYTAARVRVGTGSEEIFSIGPTADFLTAVRLANAAIREYDARRRQKGFTPSLIEVK